MAIKETMFDDLDGSMIEPDNGGTVSFAFRGQAYEVELSGENQQRLADALAPFIAVARKVPTAKRAEAAKVSSSPTDGRPYELIDARRWLLQNGHDVSKRGPIQEDLLAIYEEAHGLAGKE